MFSLGLALVMLSKWRQTRQPAPPQAADARTQHSEPKSPTEVVETYWRLSQHGDIEGANRYCAVFNDSREVLAHAGVDPAARPGVADIIWQRKWKLDGIEQEVADEDGSVLVRVRVTSHRYAHVPTMKHILRKIQGEWKIIENYW